MSSAASSSPAGAPVVGGGVDVVAATVVVLVTLANPFFTENLAIVKCRWIFSPNWNLLS